MEQRGYGLSLSLENFPNTVTLTIMQRTDLYFGLLALFQATLAFELIASISEIVFRLSRGDYLLYVAAASLIIATYLVFDGLSRLAIMLGSFDSLQNSGAVFSKIALRGVLALLFILFSTLSSSIPL